MADVVRLLLAQADGLLLVLACLLPGAGLARPLQQAQDDVANDLFSAFDFKQQPLSPLVLTERGDTCPAPTFPPP